MEVVTKDYQITDNPFEEVLLKEIWVKGRSAEASAGAIKIQFRINQTLNTSITKTFPSTGHIATVYTTYFEQLMGVNDYLKVQRSAYPLRRQWQGSTLRLRPFY
jgi:hypothetical protein